jgi:hypothetical protein
MQYNSIRTKLDDVGARREVLISKRGRIQSYLAMMREQGPIQTFNETLWCGAVKQVRIRADSIMRFIFKDVAVVEG